MAAGKLGHMKRCAVVQNISPLLVRTFMKPKNKNEEEVEASKKEGSNAGKTIRFHPGSVCRNSAERLLKLNNVQGSQDERWKREHFNREQNRNWSKDSTPASTTKPCGRSRYKRPAPTYKLALQMFV